MWRSKFMCIASIRMQLQCRRELCTSDIFVQESKSHKFTSHTCIRCMGHWLKSYCMYMYIIVPGYRCTTQWLLEQNSFVISWFLRHTAGIYSWTKRSEFWILSMSSRHAPTVTYIYGIWSLATPVHKKLTLIFMAITMTRTSSLDTFWPGLHKTCVEEWTQEQRMYLQLKKKKEDAWSK